MSKTRIARIKVFDTLSEVHDYGLGGMTSLADGRVVLLVPDERSKRGVQLVPLSAEHGWNPDTMTCARSLGPDGWHGWAEDGWLLQ